MIKDNREPNVVHIDRDDSTPNLISCGMAVDFSTPEGAQTLRKLISPEGVLRWLRAAIGNCWLELPQQDQNPVALDREMRALLEQTIESLHAHPQAFQIEGKPIDEAAADIREAQFVGDPARMMLHLAVETCHQMLPAEQQSLNAVEDHVRALFETALVDWRAGPPDLVK